MLIINCLLLIKKNEPSGFDRKEIPFQDVLYLTIWLPLRRLNEGLLWILGTSQLLHTSITARPHW